MGGYDSMDIIKSISQKLELESIGVIHVEHQTLIINEIKKLKMEGNQNDTSLFQRCTECTRSADGKMDSDGYFYCNECLERFYSASDDVPFNNDVQRAVKVVPRDNKLNAMRHKLEGKAQGNTKGQSNMYNIKEDEF